MSRVQTAPGFSAVKHIGGGDLSQALAHLFRNRSNRVWFLHNLAKIQVGMTSFTNHAVYRPLLHERWAEYSNIDSYSSEEGLIRAIITNNVTI